MGIGIIGAGNMGGAIARGIVGAGLFESKDVFLCDVISEKAETLSREIGIGTAATISDIAGKASTLLIAVKPQNMTECLQDLKDGVQPSHLIISIAAGITTAFIENAIGAGTRVVRVMPNTPALVGAGVSAICSGSHATGEDLETTEGIFAALGKTYRMEESLIDAVTAVSGSGPAYLFLFAECLEQAALKVGLPGEHAADIVAHTLYGASKLLIESDEPPSMLRARVASPGGTTAAALKTLGERNFEESVIAAVISAHVRAQELGGMKKN